MDVTISAKHLIVNKKFKNLFQEYNFPFQAYFLIYPMDNGQNIGHIFKIIYDSSRTYVMIFHRLF